MSDIILQIFYQDGVTEGLSVWKYQYNEKSNKFCYWESKTQPRSKEIQNATVYVYIFGKPASPEYKV